MVNYFYVCTAALCFLFASLVYWFFLKEELWEGTGDITYRIMKVWGWLFLLAVVFVLFVALYGIFPALTYWNLKESPRTVQEVFYQLNKASGRYQLYVPESPTLENPGPGPMA